MHKGEHGLLGLNLEDIRIVFMIVKAPYMSPVHLPRVLYHSDKSYPSTVASLFLVQALPPMTKLYTVPLPGPALIPIVSPTAPYCHVGCHTTRPTSSTRPSHTWQLVILHVRGRVRRCLAAISLDTLIPQDWFTPMAFL